jgi:hypothetical protein
MEYGVVHPTHVPYLEQFWGGGVKKQTQDAFASVDEIQGIGMKARPSYPEVGKVTLKYKWR